MYGKAFFFHHVNDHVQYMKKIQETLDGRGEFLGSHYQECKLGKWLYDEGPEEASAVSDEVRQLFDTLLEPHQRFHEISREAVRKHMEGDTTGAKSAVTEMHKISNVLISILLQLDKRSL